METQADDPLFAVRVAYQMPHEIIDPSVTVAEVAYPYTFEDALVFENLAFFASFKGKGLIRKFRDAIESGGGVHAIGKQIYEDLKTGKKAEFALDVIEAEHFDQLTIPRYIAEGLEWLQNQLEKKHIEILPKASGTTA